MSGGQNRLYNIIKELSQRHEITLICEKRSYQTQKDIEEVKKICKKVVTVERRKQWSAPNILKAAFSTHSFLYTGHVHPLMQEKIREELAKEKFDLIHVETFYVFQNLPATTIPVVLVEHNIEYKVYERFMQRAPLPLRPILALDIAKMKKEEEYSWHKAKKVAAVSEDDRKDIQEQHISTAVVPNGVNPDIFTFKDSKKAVTQEEKRILFIGDFKWIQNKDTANWIIKEIWPKIKEKQQSLPSRPNCTLWIVGRSIPNTIKSLTTDPSVLFDEKGSAAPTQEIFQKANILLAPIRVGGGTSYKVLESMSCGTPTVITPLSAQALHAADGQESQIGATADELANKVTQLLHDPKLYEKISRNGRKFIEDKYTWKAIVKKLEKVYQQAI
jgi:glycosyltransferase involved in cell wall biosynthesis